MRIQQVQLLAKVKGKGSEPSQLPNRGLPIAPDLEGSEIEVVPEMV